MDRLGYQDALVSLMGAGMSFGIASKSVAIGATCKALGLGLCIPGVNVFLAIGAGLVLVGAGIGAYVYYRNKKKQRMKEQQYQHEVKRKTVIKPYTKKDPKIDFNVVIDKKVRKKSQQKEYTSSSDDDMEFKQSHSDDQLDYDRKYIEKFRRQSLWSCQHDTEQMIASQRLDFLKEIIEKLKKENQQMIQNMIRLAKIQFMELDKFFKKVQQAIRQRSQRIVNEEFDKLKLNKQNESYQPENITPEKLSELIQKVRKFYSSPVTDPKVQQMLIELFAKMQKKMDQARQSRVENPIVKEAMAKIDSITQNVILEMTELQQIKRVLDLKNKEIAQLNFKKEVYNIGELNILKEELKIPDHAVHHIIPQNEIKKIVKNIVNNMPQQDSLKLLNDIINQTKHEPFKNYLRTKIQNQQKSKTPSQTAANTIANIVLAYIIWFPKNLVYGPKEKIRLNDPEQKVDSQILKIQSQMYRLAIKILRRALKDARKATSNSEKANFYIKGLRTFFNLPWPINGEWKKDEKSGKYYLQPSRPGHEIKNVTGIKFQKISIEDVTAQIQKDKQKLQEMQWTSEQRKAARKEIRQKKQKQSNGDGKEEEKRGRRRCSEDKTSKEK